ncbi:MAG: hypothetical protein O3B37_15230 [Proteobacteria bacterium]|nr:hypothetical protein [Pseudomonadota bacterium]
MDPDLNPLSDPPRALRFQIIVVLSLMWTAIFSAMAGVWFFYDALVIMHLLAATGVLLTGATFRAARNALSFRDQPHGNHVWDRLNGYRARTS